MKIRNGFVTNSSSSSFILTFYRGRSEENRKADEDLIKNEISRSIEPVVKQEVLDFILENALENIKTSEEIIDLVADDFFFDCVKEVEDLTGFNCRWSCEKEKYIFENCTEQESDFLEKMAKQKAINKAKQNVCTGKYYTHAVVTVGSETHGRFGDIMENIIMPEISDYRISEH